MKTNPKEKSGTIPSVDELLSIIQSLQNEMVAQRAELEAQRRELAQLRQPTNGSSLPARILSDKTTTRRRMLRKLASGAAGIAALGIATSVTAPSSQAAINTFDYNGTSAGTGLNTSAAVTQINASGATPYPIFKFSNTSSAGSGIDPNALPIGVLAQSTNGFAIYGSTTGSGTAPTAVIGVSGNNGVLTDPFVSNAVGGVVGTSSFNSGTVGLSQNSSGVEGRSLSVYGVKGISQSGVGGAFANANNDLVTGAALRLGLRAAATPPTGTSSPAHSAGEFYLDQVARVWVCTAGYQPVGPVAPLAAGTDPGFPTGPLNAAAGPNWRILSPMVFKNVPPNNPFTLDNELHVRGELWLNYTNGLLYVCISPGSTDDAVLASAGLPAGTRPGFKAVAGNPLQLLQPNSDRFVDTRPTSTVPTGGRNTPVVASSTGTSNDFQITGVTGRGGLVIPAGASGIVGNITLLPPATGAIPGAAAVKLLPGTASNFSAGTAAIVYNGSLISNSFNATLSSAGVLKVVPIGSGNMDVIIDVVGYYL